MKILYVYGRTKQRDIVRTLVKLGYEVEEYFGAQSDVWAVQEEIAQIVDYIRRNAITHLLSIHLLPNLSVAAYQTGIRYIAMLWDAPCLTMTTVFGKLDNVWVSTFDKLDYERFKAGGTKNVLYQPLTVDRVYGTVSKEILEYIRWASPDFALHNQYEVEDERFFEMRYLVRKLANIERVCCLNLLAQQFGVVLYTDSSIDSGVIRPEVKIMPPVDPGEAVSIIYAGSKINLNISLKGIERGTPLRVFEILGAGGFLLSSYCPETAELFEEDKEIVMFRTPEELLEKTEYFLTHDDEREAVAAAGQEKVLRCYTHEKKLKELFLWVEREDGH